MMKTAFTLVELMVSMAIMILVMLAVWTILKQGFLIYPVVEAAIELRQDARNAMERMVRETRESNNSTAVMSTPDSGRITFTTPRHLDQNGAQQPVQYYLNGQMQAVREYPPGTVKVVANNVSRLAFSKAGALLEISIVTSKNVDGRDLVFNLTQKVRLRNE